MTPTPPPMTGEGLQLSAASQAELEGLPLLVHRLAIVGPPLGILEILHRLVLLAGGELPELVLWQQRIELGTGAGVGVTSAALAWFSGSDISCISLKAAARSSGLEFLTMPK